MARYGWLWKDNLEEADAKMLATDRVHTKTLCDEPPSAGERGAGRVIRFNDPEVVKRQMKTVCKVGKEEFIRGHLDKALKIGRERTMFKGVQELAMAAQSGKPPLLRRGQVVFGTVSLSHAQDQDGTIRLVFVE